MLKRIKHDAQEGALACWKCIKNERKTNIKPKCFTRSCEVSEVMMSELDPWLEMFYLLKSEMFSGNGFGLEVLRQAGAFDGDVLELFAFCDGTLAECRRKQRNG